MTREAPSPTVLTSVTLTDGSIKDVYINGGVITAVTTAGTAKVDDGKYFKIDLSGHVLLPAAAEPHAHLDKALLVNRITNPTGDLNGAIVAIRSAYPSMSFDDISSRALIAISEAAAKGFTAIRTHSDCGPTLGTRSVKALVALRDRLADVIDIQVVALAEPGITGKSARANRQILADAMAEGADIVGGCPSIDDDGESAIAELLAIAREVGCGVDLHVDETTDPNMLMLRSLAEQVTKSGFNHPVTASHCVSLGMQNQKVRQETAAAVFDANISVITLPQTNLYLQGRGSATSKPRGLTAIAELLEAGVCVAGGGDNWRDPFNPMGRIDPFETASLLVTAGHLTPYMAYECVSDRARAVMGLSPVRVESGNPADLLAVRASSLVEAIAEASEYRLVLRKGRILSRTTVQHQLDELLA